MAAKRDLPSNSIMSEKIENKTAFSPLPDSSVYLHKLEHKLSKVKGCSKELNSKDLISVLQNAREDHMNRFISQKEESPYSSAYDKEDKEIATSYIERKLFPEKSGATLEELQHLLKSDVLSNVLLETEIADNIER